ncbi:4-(cytidine 5'-diphospho)-2-C-methyl-D-erythritol kinase [Defluviimonas sp. WL0024]|uniref:4-diphosphocytidyl-2-C-methyl-D-erythritol kinase n=2 Tax=Albidovulum TaxID=205889 RepID=A0ABT3IZ69_9RHOB|nr:MULTISPECIES: 4-(cytidine 5'-diphospho)-2-C-methyl-D-erythritol kinase [Defluviimonas]MCU9848290.1 4-(cytidine 5'-diphospho)-2-C-methyl-D-erythritol kinase [Defluviimonas sp. WL0024]MCW3780724.1 4-(cytidine 5'-diphospho)-2-C-methyl-D-erythritol kinase [Defluviimonas salinarum]
MANESFAAAKVNLTLHVTGRRADGYHLLDSLVVFAGTGDRIRVSESESLGLTITGPEGAGLDAGADNLVLRAARAFEVERGAAIELDKQLPVASGIGGGSADAAATLSALARLWNLPLPAPDAVLALGADVPVCLAGRPARMRGIGERLDPVGGLPEGLALVLVNPRVAVPTPAVFAALERRDNPPITEIPKGCDATDFALWLAVQRNDLEAPAIAIAPVIAEVLAALRACGGLLSRMSGSGATCFGLFADLAAATRAARRISIEKPGWWTRAAPVLSAPAA